jgi:hypothetical protein
MINLPDCTISPTHARGLRRQHDRWVAHKFAIWNPPGMPRRFGPRVRAEEAELRALFGADHVLRADLGKKETHLFLVDRDEHDLYRLHVTILKRCPDRVSGRRGRLPVAATAHAYERTIQGFARAGYGLVDVLHSVMLTLFRDVGYERAPTAPEEEQDVWKRAGNARVWLPQGLAIVVVPERGDAVIRTVIPAVGLIGKNRELWETMGKGGSKVSFQRAARKPTESH